jgi:hypothetical protein
MRVLDKKKNGDLSKFFEIWTLQEFWTQKRLNIKNSTNLQKLT